MHNVVYCKNHWPSKTSLIDKDSVRTKNYEWNSNAKQWYQKWTRETVKPWLSPTFTILSVPVIHSFTPLRLSQCFHTLWQKQWWICHLKCQVMGADYINTSAKQNVFDSPSLTTSDGLIYWRSSKERQWMKPWHLSQIVEKLLRIYIECCSKCTVTAIVTVLLPQASCKNSIVGNSTLRMQCTSIEYIYYFVFITFI